MKNLWKIVIVILILGFIIIGGVLLEMYFNENTNNKKDDEFQNQFLSENVVEIQNSLIDNNMSIEKYKALENLNEKDGDLNLNSFIENEYYVLKNDGIVYNVDELDKFINSVNENTFNTIRIVQYTASGQKVFKDIEFTKDKFIVKIDNRWDASLSVEDKKIIINEYDFNNYKLVKDNIPYQIVDSKNYYKINLVSNNNLEKIYLSDYLEVTINDESNFKLEFNKDLTKGKESILLKSENTKYDYDIYSYNGQVNIIINDEKLLLRDALLNDKITVEQILEKANKDANENKTIFNARYLDGGSQIYYYEDYAILKYNTLSGNKDLYIGNPAIDIAIVDEI